MRTFGRVGVLANATSALDRQGSTRVESSLPGCVTGRWFRQTVVLCVLAIQNTALVLLTKYSWRKDAMPYSVSTVIVCAELLKLTLSYLLTMILDGRHAVRDSLRELPAKSSQLVIPSALYVVQNNLVFHGVKLLSPTLYMVCSQSKILTSAVWSVLLLDTRITRKQCISLVILVFGMILAQRDEASHQNTSSTGNFRTSETLCGVLLVFTAALTSGFAGAYLEKIYKEGRRERSVWFRNTQLACFSLPVALTLVLWRDAHLVKGGQILRGFDNIVIGIVLLQAIGGLAVAAVLAHAGNVLKCFAISISICACVLVGVLASDGDRQMTLTVMVGVGLVLYATFLYSGII